MATTKSVCLSLYLIQAFLLRSVTSEETLSGLDEAAKTKIMSELKLWIRSMHDNGKKILEVNKVQVKAYLTRLWLLYRQDEIMNSYQEKIADIARPGRQLW